MLNKKIIFHTKQSRLFYQPLAKKLEHLFPKFLSTELSMFPSCAELNQGFCAVNCNQKKLSFILQTQDMPFVDLGYEQRIFSHGYIATRPENWHDFFNALVWLNYPQTKSALNSIHCQEILVQDSSNRSRKRDLLTLFDESGVVVMADDFILELIRAHQWKELFIENKALWQNGEIQMVTFGHALYEKYLNPYIGMTAQALLLNKKHLDLDGFLAENLLSHDLLQSKAELSPLPLLGIPNWHKNQNTAFYANKNYFR